MSVKTDYLSNYHSYYIDDLEPVWDNIIIEGDNTMLLTLKEKYVKLITSLKRVGKKQTTKKKGSKMKTKQLKTNIITFIQVGAIAGLVSIAIYLGIPELSVENVLSLASLVSAFALAFTFIKR